MSDSDPQPGPPRELSKALYPNASADRYPFDTDLARTETEIVEVALWAPQGSSGVRDQFLECDIHTSDE